MEQAPWSTVLRMRLEDKVLPRLQEEAKIEREPPEIVEPVLAGAGRDQAIRFFAESIREIQQIDSQRLTVRDIPGQDRFRVVGGIASACSNYQGFIDVMIDDRGSRDLVEEIERLGGQHWSERNPQGAVPFSVQVLIPRTELPEVKGPLWKAHRSHLPESIDYGQPTHLHEHRPDLMRYLLDEADRLGS